MLEVFSRIIDSLLVVITGFYIIKNILQTNTKLFNKKTLLYICISVVAVVLMHKIQYTGLYTITICLLNVIIYKGIFDIKLQESLICVGLLMVIMFLGDLIVSLIFTNLYDVNEIRGNPILFILTNTLVCIFSIILIKIKPIRAKFQKFYLNIIPKQTLINVVFFILIIIAFSLLTYNLSITWKWDSRYIINTIIIIVLGVIAYIFVDNKNNYIKLSGEYDNLFNYIQNFEDWIEKEQLNRHEYKNQLATLRDMTKEKKLKTKIDEILEDDININGDIVNQLRTLPKGGIKGLMYYKLVIAQKNKINLTIDVSLKKKSILNKLSEKQVRDLCKLIGIYFDNAIEAAKETRKKNVLVEIYEFKDKANIVFSNTFKKSKRFDNRYDKGISTKGKGRGNGLYFANKIISKNKWIDETQEIIDKYYIQKICILKLEK